MHTKNKVPKQRELDKRIALSIDSARHKIESSAAQYTVFVIKPWYKNKNIVPLSKTANTAVLH